MFISHLLLDVPRGYFTRDFPMKILYAFLVSPIVAS
jgi:hypothetical protein